MPIDPAVAIGAEVGSVDFSWSETDVLLYQLAIGAKNLSYTLETAGLQVLPSFAVVAPTFHMTDPPPHDLPGCDIDLAQVVHGSQSVTVHGPLPTTGSARLTTRITDVWDKGKAAVIGQEGTATSVEGPDSRELWTVRSSIFVRGEGGWGGDRGSSEPVTPPDRSPDLETSYDVRDDQALLYRLCGDRNPLHADPAFAQKAGFPAPILHGLCTWGIALREVTEGLLSADAGSVGGFSARFAGVVFPGETIHVRAWDEGERILLDATDGDDHRPALADGVLVRA